MLNSAFTPALLRTIPCLRQEEENSLYERICFDMLNAAANNKVSITEWFVTQSEPFRAWVVKIIQPFVDQGFNVVVSHEYEKTKVVISWEFPEGETTVSHCDSVVIPAVCSAEHSLASMPTTTPYGA